MNDFRVQAILHCFSFCRQVELTLVLHGLSNHKHRLETLCLFTDYRNGNAPVHDVWKNPLCIYQCMHATG